MDTQTAAIIDKWTKAKLYVYLRPISSTFDAPTKPHRTVWRCDVEYRNVNWKKASGVGNTLDEAVEDAHKQLGDVYLPNRTRKRRKLRKHIGT